MTPDRLYRRSLSSWQKPSLISLVGTSHKLAYDTELTLGESEGTYIIIQFYANASKRIMLR